MLPPYLATFNVQSSLKMPVVTFSVHTKHKVCAAFKERNLMRVRTHSMFLIHPLQYYPHKHAYVLFPGKFNHTNVICEIPGF